MFQESLPLVSIPARRQAPVCESVHPSTSRQFTVTNGQGRWEAALYSFCMRGVELVLGSRLEAGVVLGVELARRSRFFSSQRMLRVGQVSQRPDGTYLTECQFYYPLAFDQLYDLVS